MSVFQTAPAHPTSFLLGLEGLEGSGKTTQGKKLQHYFNALGKQAHLFREPGGTPFGEALRQSILNSDAPLSPMTEAYLFACSRCQLMEQKVLPTLQRPQQVVILDRYYHSSVAYQGFGRGLGPETIAHLHSLPPLLYRPHLTVFVHIDHTTVSQRLHQRGSPKDYFESEKQDFFQRVDQGYHWCLQEDPQRVVKVNGMASPERVTEEICTLYRKRCGE